MKIYEIVQKNCTDFCIKVLEEVHLVRSPTFLEKANHITWHVA